MGDPIKKSQNSQQGFCWRWEVNNILASWHSIYSNALNGNATHRNWTTPRCWFMQGTNSFPWANNSTSSLVICCSHIISRWWFHIFLYFHPYLGRWTVWWLIFFGWFVSTGMDPHICATCTSYEYMSPADACHVWLKAQGCDLYRTGKVSEVQKKREWSCTISHICTADITDLL